MKEWTYTRVGDYYIPDLKLPEGAGKSHESGSKGDCIPKLKEALSENKYVIHFGI